MKYIFTFVFTITISLSVFCCTSFIISGQKTLDGRAVMLKHRDASELNNRVAYFSGPKYAFIGLVNSPSGGGEVWAGTNEAGFCIMNTASYNFRDDTVRCAMDREGIVMYEALGRCADIADFEAFMNAYPKPMGVEANFGVIDAKGGAAYYEVNNFRWIKYDVNASPEGYRVVTNYCEAGREAQKRGVERYQTAAKIMQENFLPTQPFAHHQAYSLLSRSFRHDFLGVEWTSANAPRRLVDQDFIPRYSTSASIVFEGVQQGEDPLHTVMWTLLGYPATSVALPLMVMTRGDGLPTCVVKGAKGANCEMCDVSLQLKNAFVFPFKVSNGKEYLDSEAVLKGTTDKPALNACAERAEMQIDSLFNSVFLPLRNGTMTKAEFVEAYKAQTPFYWRAFQDAYAPWLK